MFDFVLYCGVKFFWRGRLVVWLKKSMEYVYWRCFFFYVGYRLCFFLIVNSGFVVYFFNDLDN